MPALIVAAYTASLGIKGMACLALLASLLCCISLGLLLRFSGKIASLEVSLQTAPTDSENRAKEEVHRLHLEMDKKLEEMRCTYHEFEDLKKEYHRLEEEMIHLKEQSQKELKHKELLLSEYQKTISEQRKIIEKKQSYISQLETKVRDLMYEIRNLLQLDSSSKDGLNINEQAMIDSFLLPAPLPHTPYDFSLQLHKYIEKAENLTGVDHLSYAKGKSPRFLDLTLESYAIDRRRLFECFKDETAGILFIYSPVDKNFLFVSSLVKSLTGWGPEKFMKEFPRLAVKGYFDWEEALLKTKMFKESATKLVIMDKAGHPKPFECYMGMISKGPFSQHVFGILTNQ